MMLRRYHKKEVIAEEVTEEIDIEETEEETRIEDLTEDELQKIKNDDIKARLDKLEIEYDSNAKKKELIALLIGKVQEQEETEQEGD